MKKIQVEGTPIPKGHYSQAIVHNGLVYVSGQLPMGLVIGEPLLGDIEAQTEAALLNVETVLKAAGSSLDQVVQMTIYISDMEYWGKVNEVYARVMGGHRPARAIVPVKELHFGLGIEIQAIAAVSE
jgi:2-iminobutanoate/2-iminopropanoate deaminase